MKLKYIAFILSFTISLEPYAQVWQSKFGYESDEISSDIIETSDGGFICVGHTTSTSDFSNKNYMVKVDAWGDEVWEYYMPNDSTTSVINNVYQTEDNRIFISIDERNLMKIVEISGDGSSLGTRFSIDTIEQIRPKKILQTYDKGFMILADGVIDQDDKIFLIKLNKDFNIDWIKNYSFGNEDLEDSESFIETMDKGFLIVGSVNYWSDFQNKESFMLKVDQFGVEEWYAEIGGEPGRNCKEFSTSVIQVHSNAYYVSGTWDVNCGSELFISKLNGKGEIQWTKFYEGNNSNGPLGGFLFQEGDNRLKLIGESETDDILLIDIDTSGAILKMENIGDPNLWEQPSAVKKSRVGGYIICGDASSQGTTNIDIFLMKTDTAGIITNQTNITIENKEVAFITPNPLSHTGRVEYIGERLPNNIKLELIDLNGRIVKTEKLTSGNLYFNIKGLPTGMYLYQLTENDGTNYTGKVMITE